MTCYSVEICPASREPFAIADCFHSDLGFRRLDQLVQEAITEWARSFRTRGVAVPQVRVTVNGIEIYRWAISQDRGEGPRLRPLT